MKSLATLVKVAQNTELPLAALRAIAELRGALASLERVNIKEARGKGASWEETAEALGVTRQAVQQRFKNGDSPEKP